MANKKFLTLFQKNSYLIFKPSALLPLANKSFLPYFQTLISSFMANKKKFTLFSNPNFFFHGEQKKILPYFQTLISCKQSLLYCLQSLILSMARFCILFIYFSTLISSMAEKLPMSVTNPKCFHGKTSCISIYKPYFFPWQILPILFGLAPHY
jgi:hypothetical protein